MNQIELAPQVPAVEAQNPLAAAGATMHQFAGRIGASFRSGIEAIREAPRNIKTLTALGTTAVTLFAAAHAEAANADPESAALGNVPALDGAATLSNTPTDLDPRRPILNTPRIGVGRAVEVGNGRNYLADSSTTETTSSTTGASRHECIEAGLANPKALNPAGMYSAGVRPDGPVHTSQIIRGAYEFSDITEECPPELGLVRYSLGTVQMLKDGKWKNITWPGLPGNMTNEGGLATIWNAPPHAFPSYVFNDYMPKKHAFHKVRIDLESTMRNEQSLNTVASRHTFLPVEVHGKGKQAMRSKRAADRQWQARH